MFRSFVILLILAISLSALSNREILKRADGFMRHGSKSDQFRAYNDYKNLYLRSIMSEDKNLKIHSLQGIVKSGRKLHIDVSQYAKELSQIKTTPAYRTPKPKRKIKKKHRIKIRSSHKLKFVEWHDGKLVLKFDKKLSSKQINYFTLYDSKRKQHKYVFDIHASMLSKSQTLRKDGVKRIKLAQYNSNTLRLVIENSKRLKISFKKYSNKLIITIKTTTTKKSTYAKKVSKKARVPLRVDRNKVIVLDAGHGGKDPGAIGYRGYREKVIVLQIVKELNRILATRGYKVYMSRPYDKFVKLRNRTKYANRRHADIFISVHANSVSRKKASKACGIECYFLSPSRSSRATRVAAKENSADMSDMKAYEQNNFLGLLNRHKIIASNKLAIDLQGGALQSLRRHYKGVKDGGVREGPFWVLVGAQMPAVLVEVGFVSNPTEAKRLVNRNYQKKLALGLANGIERYFANN